MTPLIAGVHVGPAAVTAWVADRDGRQVDGETLALPVRRPAPDRVEFDPTDWWAEVRQALASVVRRNPAEYLGLTASAARTAFLLTDGRVELGQGVLPGDRRGAGWTERVRGHHQLYAMTRHWAAPDLPLAALLAIRAESPRLWAQARRLLFVHDWLLWRLGGVEVSELSYACAAGLAHVSQRGWAGSLLDDLEVPRAWLPALVAPGDVVGALREPDLGLPTGLPVVAGCGDVQLAAAGAGAAHPGVVAVAAGAATTLLGTAEFAPLDPGQRVEVSTHVPRRLWAVELGCGSPGPMLTWLADLLGTTPSELFDLAAGVPPGAGGLHAALGPARVGGPPGPPGGSLLGLRPTTSAGELATAFVEGYAFAVRASLGTVEDVLGYPARQLVLTGPDARPGLARALAGIVGRDVALALSAAPAVLASAALVAVAVGASSAATVPDHVLFPAAPEAGVYDQPYQAYLTNLTSTGSGHGAGGRHPL